MKRKITTVVIHHTDSAEDTTLEQLRQFHIEKGLISPNDPYCGYHWVVRRNGNVWECLQSRPEYLSGAHCENNNSHTIGLAICGKYSKYSPDEKAYAMAAEALYYILSRNNLLLSAIKPHKSFKKTECPGNFFNIEHLKALTTAYFK